MKQENDCMVTIDELRKLDMLQWVDIVSVQGLLQNCPVMSLQTGDALLKAGTANRTMFMVLEGRFGVYLDSNCRECIAELSAGGTVGEMSVIDERPTSATVRALEPGRVLAVDEDTFWLIVAASHAFSANLLVMLSGRMRETNRAIAKNIKLRQRFEKEAKVDILTGLHNRRWFDENLPRMVGRHERTRQPLSLLMMDVDGFKRYNDTYGHQTGDAALSRIGAILGSMMRPTDLMARYGGEEFVVMLPLTDSAGALLAAERVRNAVAAETASLLLSGECLTVSVGIAQLAAAETPESFVARADAALYRAKAAGRNRSEKD
ncbi:MAG: GGDEF domain-containing protein [Candidatus Fermentibacteraceae bacterium]